MTIKRRIFLSFLSLGISAALIGMLSIYTLRIQRDRFIASRNDLLFLSRLVQIRDFLEKAGKSVEYYYYLEDFGSKTQFVDTYKDLQDHMGNIDFEKKDIFMQETENFRSAAEAAFQFSEKKESRKAEQLFRERVFPELQELKKTISELLNKQNQKIELTWQKTLKMQTRYSILLMLFVAGILGVVLILSISVYSSIIEPLHYFLAGIKKIVEGNINHRFQLKRKDELSNLAEAFNSMLDEIKKLQLQVTQMSKMSAVGQLAGGVAHEINNPLTGILGQTQLLLSKPDLDPSMKEKLEKVERAAFRCQRIVRGLLDFSRQREYEFAEMDVNEVVEESLLLCASEMKASGVKVIKKFAPVVKATMSRPHMEQVFINIIVNSFQAMPHGGVLIIETRASVEIEEKEGQFLEVSFRDTGLGMTKEELIRIFEPFYTTKEVGKGTGLGLTVVYGIIEAHKGHIKADSPGKNKGSTIKIFLPAQ